MSAVPELSNQQARWLFLKSHALATPAKTQSSAADVLDLVRQLGFVQVDSINTVARAHHMILWSRDHAYQPAHLKQLLETDRSLWEHWTHDASLLPTETHPFWQHRFARDTERLHKNWKSWFRDGYEAQFDTILDRIAAGGPLTSSDVGVGEPRGKGGWWDWHPSKTALEWLWRTGQLAIARRDGFQKVYDLTDRVIPAAHLQPAPDVEALCEWSCKSALDRLGFATPKELQAFYNAITPAEAKDWAKTAIAKGEVIEVDVIGVDGTPRRSVMRPETHASLPNLARPTDQLRLLSPFDPALRDRDRALRLFGFHYRIEVFVPEPKRQYGYYVFPVIEADQLIGRIDVKAFRDESTLRVRAFWPELGVKLSALRKRKLTEELSQLATFSGCETLDFSPDWLRD